MVALRVFICGRRLPPPQRVLFGSLAALRSRPRRVRRGGVVSGRPPDLIERSSLRECVTVKSATTVRVLPYFDAFVVSGQPRDGCSQARPQPACSHLRARLATTLCCSSITSAAACVAPAALRWEARHHRRTPLPPNRSATPRARRRDRTSGLRHAGQTPTDAGHRDRRPARLNRTGGPVQHRS